MAQCAKQGAASRKLSRAFGVLLCLAGATMAHAQHASSVPEGVAEGKGAANPKGQYAELESLPDWGGVWFVKRGAARAQPKLKGDYLRRWEEWRADVVANGGVEQRDRSNCSPPGLPRIMQLPQYPYEFLFTPGRVTMNQEAWMQTRTIWTDGRSHIEDPDPTFHGHSIGHWENDTLVVDTIGISDELEFGEGARHSGQFHLTERIHLADGDPDTLVNEMRMDDPESLVEPYQITVTYARDRYGSLLEFQCAENDRNPVGADGQTHFE